MSGEETKTAARYAGTVLRESRSIVETIQIKGQVGTLKAPIERLRKALDLLEWQLAKGPSA